MILDVDAQARSYGKDGQAAIVDFLESVAASMKERMAALNLEPQGVEAQDVRSQPRVRAKPQNKEG